MVRMLCSLVGVAVLFAASPSAQVAAVRTPTKAAAAVTSPINLNSATQAELETLPGIGAKTAARIIDYRQKKGRIADLSVTLNPPIEYDASSAHRFVHPLLLLSRSHPHPLSDPRPPAFGVNRPR